MEESNKKKKKKKKKKNGPKELIAERAIDIMLV